ncbi:MAG TPA: GerMN domain-containing protein [Clostridia bacterium]|nr:GerMN domain-containing protein [Clostridia bacterium]
MKKHSKIIILILISVLISALAIGCACEEEMPPDEAGETEEENTAVLEESKISYVLYLKYADKPYLSPERFQKTLPADDLRTPMEVALDELLAYQGDGMLVGPIPDGVELNSVFISGKNIEVDFTGEFLEAVMPSEDAKVVIAAVVNTLLFNQEDAETVSIKIDGSLLKEFNGYSFEPPLGFFEDDIFPDK